MIVLAYLASQFIKLAGRADFYLLLFGVLYLASCDFAMDPTKEQHRIETKKGETGESILIIFFDIKGTDHKEFLLACQTQYTTVTFYSDCVKLCEDFDPNFRKKL
jgi:hypothetical protein